MNKNYYAVIMAGGIGSRFWPLSTKEFPKQFHDILGTGETLIQKTVNRFEYLIPSNNILIATNEAYKSLVLTQLNNVSENQLLLEPTMRNTAPCILYSAFKIYNENPNGIMVVAPSDHWIENEQNFISNLKTSFEFCEYNDALLTLGIKPTSPNIGFGYINFENSKKSLKKVLQFTEKPTLKKAKSFIESGDYLWNAGIFIWSVRSILKAFKLHLPELYQLFKSGELNYGTTSEKEFIQNNYAKAENISIDFGIMEKANNVFVLPTSFSWNDLGTWDSLYKMLPKDNQNNVAINTKTISRDSHNNIIRTTKGKKVVIQGLSNYIVIEKDNVLLICPKDREQDIKEITQEVKKTFGDEYV